MHPACHQPPSQSLNEASSNDHHLVDRRIAIRLDILPGMARCMHSTQGPQSGIDCLQEAAMYIGVGTLVVILLILLILVLLRDTTI
jgi:hypothetical protein